MCQVVSDILWKFSDDEFVTIFSEEYCNVRVCVISSLSFKGK